MADFESGVIVSPHAHLIKKKWDRRLQWLPKFLGISNVFTDSTAEASKESTGVLCDYLNLIFRYTICAQSMSALFLALRTRWKNNDLLISLYFRCLSRYTHRY